MRTDGNGTTEWFGIKAKCRIKFFIKVGIASDGKTLWLFRRVYDPASGVIGRTKENAAGGSLKLLFLRDQLVVESGFIAFEECGTAKYTKVGEAGFPVV